MRSSGAAGRGICRTTVADLSRIDGEALLLNRLEYVLMNNPVRAGLQRRFEAKRLLRMGGPIDGARALEIGCGRGVGAEIILDVFRANTVDAFDLDPRMVRLARQRLAAQGRRARFWVGDATSIPTVDSTYDAVFDFGIIHHVPHWRHALAEIRRVLKPGGTFYAEEMLSGFIQHPVVRRLLRHPQADRFDGASFRAGLDEAGLEPHGTRDLWNIAAWYIARKPEASRGSTIER